MKFKKLKYIFPAFLAITMLSGCGSDPAPTPGPDPEPTPAPIHFDKYTLPEEAASSYYSGFNMKAGKRAMLTQIHEWHFKKHTKWVNYGSVAGYYKSTSTRPSIDAPDKTSGKIEYIYTGSVGPSYSNGNREHVWPCANSAKMWDRNATDPEKDIDDANYVGGGSDLYHVRPCDATVNSARGNSKFVDKKDFANLSWKEVKEKNATRTGIYSVWCEGLDSSGQFANKTELPDEYKGDIARILVYVYTHYAAIGTLDPKYQKYCGGLSFSAVLGYEEEECKRKLCEWNELDPPSETETLRNETVQGIQGNRNMFVDYPALMPRIFGWY